MDRAIAEFRAAIENHAVVYLAATRAWRERGGRWTDYQSPIRQANECLGRARKRVDMLLLARGMDICVRGNDAALRALSCQH